MKNVYDIKKEKNLNFILPLKHSLNELTQGLESSLITVYLYYEDSLSLYLDYISNIPPQMDILFITSNEQVYEKLVIYASGLTNNTKVVLKENRGRDVSALLTAAREDILKYQYVCFLHDKKAKSVETQKDTDLFVKCLWDNMLGSKAYILNIISTFIENSRLGVLLPPESISDNFSFVFKNTWDLDFILTEELISKLGLVCDLDMNKKPISLGTVFWAKVEALKKLFFYEWRDEDFVEEPLPGDGTISHAIERCFAYVAQDAGFDTGIVMSDEYAGNRFDVMEEVLTEAFQLLGNTLKIDSIGMLKQRNEVCSPVFNFSKKYPKLYIFGAGIYGQRCARLLGTGVKGFIVTKKDTEEYKVNGMVVEEFCNVELDDETGIIVAVSEKYRDEILKIISDRAFENVFCFM